MPTTRFAPSPTGDLHIGHAAAALFAQAAAGEGGRFLLRLEDIDVTRCQASFAEGFFEDLRWLGLAWEEPVRRQSEHLPDYAAALESLKARGLLYPCFCTRREILAEAAASATAPHDGEGPVYPGTCRMFTLAEREEKAASRPAVWRLDMAKAMQGAGPLVWQDRARGEVRAHPERFGDIVLARKDVPTSYHLSVTVDDALQGVTLVTRGEDLFGVTDIHVLLQKLLDYPPPLYHHHPLLLDEGGKRFAKRDKAVTLRALRESGVTPEEIKARIVATGFPL